MLLHAFVTTLLLCQSTSFALAIPDLELQPAPFDAPLIEAVELEQGESAPFAGQLLEPETAIRLGTLAAQCKDRIQAEVELVRRGGDYKLRAERMLRGLDQDDAKRREELLRGEIERARVWYRDPLFVAPVTAVLTVVAIILARETVIEGR